MKKLIMTLGAVATATFVNAASVQWGGAISTPDVSKTLPEGTQCALLWSATSFSGSATSLTGFSVGSTANNGGAIVNVYSIDDIQSGNWEFATTWDKTDSDVNGFYAILVLNEEGTKASYMDMGEISGTTATSSLQRLIYNEGWSPLGNTASLTTGGYTVNVPEPTSGLLMLLGMAGLALRRRRA